MKRRLADTSATDRVPFVDSRFHERIGGLTARPQRPDRDAPLHPETALTPRLAMSLFRSQLESRHIDLCARELKRRGDGFYTISSAGHEGNAAVAAALRNSDPALLHYRAGAFFLERARKAGLESAPLDVLLGAVASADDPIAGGRHKVFGSRRLAIPPQTSTIGSHLPKAVGMAFALERARRVGITLEIPADAIVACSFGDASANHSTSTGAINAACWAAHRGAPMPLLFICEDNGLGISVRTHHQWVRDNFSERPGLSYFQADGLDMVSAYDTARAAVHHVREKRAPAFLHVRVVRLLGHAGSDIETLYRSVDEIEHDESRDPLIRSAELLVNEGVAKPDELCELYEYTRQRIAAFGEVASGRRKLETAAEIAAPLAPRDADAVAEEIARPWDHEARRAFWNDKMPEDGRPAPLSLQLNRALGDLLVRYPELLIFGQDVADKGGVYGITRGLNRRGKRGRVFDTLLDEQTILGTAIGAGQLGLLPIAEIQYLAYLHNAEDQLRGEAASLQFFSLGQFRNPMVVRIAAYAYQKGFGGHFHNDNALGVLRDIPGLIIASPSRGDDAVAMLQTCVASAHVDGSVCVFLEPIALYPIRDLHDKGDGGWCSDYRVDREHVPLGKARVYREDADDLLIVSWANGLWMSLRAAGRLAKQGIHCRVLDLRWLAPLPVDDLLAQATAVGKVLVVDETRKTGGVSEGIITALVEGGFGGAMQRVTASDSFVPLGDAANRVLVQEDDIERAAIELAAR